VRLHQQFAGKKMLQVKEGRKKHPKVITKKNVELLPCMMYMSYSLWAGEQLVDTLFNTSFQVVQWKISKSLN